MNVISCEEEQANDDGDSRFDMRYLDHEDSCQAGITCLSGRELHHPPGTASRCRVIAGPFRSGAHRALGRRPIGR
jgi:hypothetical protein